MGIETADAIPMDRRMRRRRETIEEVLDTAVEIMAEQGVAGLSVGEIARRMGMRTPSLYVYFPSKNALYDALFARGARLVLEEMRSHDTVEAVEELGLEPGLLVGAKRFVRWTMENQAYSQLLFWRPVPGFEPTAESYQSAVQLVEWSLAGWDRLQRKGLVRGDVPADRVQRDWTVIISGVISQQLSNAPNETFENGRFTASLPGLVSMFARFYAAPTDTPRRQAKGR